MKKQIGFEEMTLEAFEKRYFVRYQPTLEEQQLKQFDLVRFVQSMTEQDLTFVAAGYHMEETLICFDHRRKVDGIEAKNCDFINVEGLLLVLRQGMFLAIF